MQLFEIVSLAVTLSAGSTWPRPSVASTSIQTAERNLHPQCPLGCSSRSASDCGVTNGPTSYFRLVDKVSKDIPPSAMLSFIDGGIMRSSGLSQRLVSLKQTLQGCYNGFKPVPHKRTVFVPGHTCLWAFHGIVGYNWQHIMSYMRIAKLLTLSEKPTRRARPSNCKNEMIMGFSLLPGAWGRSFRLDTDFSLTQSTGILTHRKDSYHLRLRETERQTTKLSNPQRRITCWNHLLGVVWILSAVRKIQMTYRQRSPETVSHDCDGIQRDDHRALGVHMGRLWLWRETLCWYQAQRHWHIESRRTARTSQPSNYNILFIFKVYLLTKMYYSNRKFASGAKILKFWYMMSFTTASNSNKFEACMSTFDDIPISAHWCCQKWSAVLFALKCMMTGRIDALTAGSWDLPWSTPDHKSIVSYIDTSAFALSTSLWNSSGEHMKWCVSVSPSSHHALRTHRMQKLVELKICSAKADKGGNRTKFSFHFQLPAGYTWQSLYLSYFCNNRPWQKVTRILPCQSQNQTDPPLLRIWCSKTPLHTSKQSASSCYEWPLLRGADVSTCSELSSFMFCCCNTR